MNILSNFKFVCLMLIDAGGPAMFHVNDVAKYLANDQFRVFLRFCKYSSSNIEHNDCLPKAFNLIINNTAFQASLLNLFQNSKVIFGVLFFRLKINIPLLHMT